METKVKYVAEFGAQWKEFTDYHEAERWLDNLEAITGKVGFIEVVKAQEA